MIEHYRPLIHALVDAFMLLESTGSDEVNPDTAVRGMETMASSILVLEKSDQLALRAELEEIARSRAQDKAYGDFVRALPEMLGLVSPQPE
jgi:hypothetical protein